VSVAPSERSRGALALVGTTALWGISFPLVGDVVAGRTQGQLLCFLALRFGLATLAFLPLGGALRDATRAAGARAWALAGGVGVVLFAGFYLQTWGLMHTSPGRSAFITVLSVPMVPLFAALLHRRRPSPVHLAASGLATLGIGLVLAPGGALEPNLGDLLTLLSAVAFALQILLLEVATRRAPTVIVAVGQIAAVGVVAALALLLVPLELPAEWPGLWRGVGVTGILCTTLALGLMTWGQARVRAEVAAVLFALEPVFAALFEWLFFGAGLGPWQLGGAAVVFGSVVWAARVPVEAEG
jgi:drug/metabolite transporter (DMT)-like permease